MVDCVAFLLCMKWFFFLFCVCLLVLWKKSKRTKYLQNKKKVVRRVSLEPFAVCAGNHLPDVKAGNVISMQQCTIIAQLIPLRSWGTLWSLRVWRSPWRRRASLLETSFMRQWKCVTGNFTSFCLSACSSVDSHDIPLTHLLLERPFSCFAVCRLHTELMWELKSAVCFWF